MSKALNLGMIGYGFMGRAHSNAYTKVNHFFDLEYKPVLKAICARDEGKAKAFAEQWVYESVELTDALRPWTIDIHIAQNDATIHGSGTHDKTGRHCLPKDPNGKLDVVKRAGYWMRDSYGNVLKKYRHLCWDGCMVMLKPQTWNDILAAMLAVRDAHGWRE